uniref:Nudix hydrolase domain-containing protein n=1 Tax=viral metagenome TaxID=1070528 RepID=A0A6C0D410_9ZZZZ
MAEGYCNNCGKPGHLYHQCKMPITSIGLIVYRIIPTTKIVQYLMICRKDTLGYIDFMRGKYSVYNKYYLMNMLKQMTQSEKERIKCLTFDELWTDIWGNEEISLQYKSEESVSRDKFNILKNGIMVKNDYYSLETMIGESNNEMVWQEPEWGFPKGRRNYQEKDYVCAIREFTEETGYRGNQIHNIKNLLPFEEIFIGSNYKSYKHKYYLTYMNYENSFITKPFERSEVSKMEWKTYDECIEVIRPYNLEKKRLLTNIHNTITQFSIIGNIV